MNEFRRQMLSNNVKVLVIAGTNQQYSDVCLVFNVQIFNKAIIRCNTS